MTQKWRVLLAKLTFFSWVRILQLVPHILPVSTDFFPPSGHRSLRTLNCVLPTFWPLFVFVLSTHHCNSRWTTRKEMRVKSQRGKELGDGWKRDLNWSVRRGMISHCLCLITVSQQLRRSPTCALFEGKKAKWLGKHFLFLSLCHFKMEEFWILAVNQMAFTALSWHGAAEKLKWGMLIPFPFPWKLVTNWWKQGRSNFWTRMLKKITLLKLFSCIRMKRIVSALEHADVRVNKQFTTGLSLQLFSYHDNYMRGVFFGQGELPFGGWIAINPINK